VARRFGTEFACLLRWRLGDPPSCRVVWTARSRRDRPRRKIGEARPVPPALHPADAPDAPDALLQMISPLGRSSPAARDTFLADLG